VNIFTVISTTCKKEVRFEGDFQDTLPRSRSYSGKAHSRSSGRRRKGGRQRKSTTHDQSRHERGTREEHRRTRASRHSSSSHTDEPSTSAQARLIEVKRHNNNDDDDDDDETETTRSICSTCSSSSSDSDDFAYELPQRQVYGGVRVNYVPNDALACARKEQQTRNDHSASDRDKNCTIS
jgi:prickle